MPFPDTTPRTDSDHDRRMRWFREARFGMFIHFGLYSSAGGVWNGRDLPGVGEWLMSNGRIPVSEYQQLLERFNPVAFDADAWAKTAKDAGMRYLVLTSKHHDGFCLWDSDHTDWDVMSTPFRRDILQELSGACRRNGVKFCLYHSIMDWHHPDYLPRPGWDKRSTAGVDFDRYVAYMKNQLKEIVRKYGPLGILWFDGEWEPTWTHERGLDLYRTVRSLQRDILVNNRVDKGRNGMQGLTTDERYAGDFGTPEQEIPPTGLPGVDWESCMTMNTSWGYKASDTRWKSSDELLRNLIDIASKGGNYLLNVGPDGRGEIPAASRDRLRDIGVWMRRNGQAIHGTVANPFKTVPAWGRVTRKEGRPGDTLYLHVFDSKTKRVAFPHPGATPVRASVLGSSVKPAVSNTASGFELDVPDMGASTIRVVKVDLAGKVSVA